MGIVITFTNTDPVPDPTGWADWLTLVVVCLYSIAVVVVCTMMMIMRKRFFPLRTKNLPNTLAMCCFGLIHCWSTFVGNRHIDIMSDSFKEYSCGIINFWLQYLVGLNGWFCVLYLRLLEQTLRWDKSYTEAFSKDGGDQANIERNRSSYFRSLAYMLVNASSWPLGVICILVTALHGSYFEEGSCHTYLVYKVSLGIWVVSCSCVLAAANHRVSKHVESQFFSEYLALNSIVKVGLVIVAVNAAVNVTGLVSYSIGRAIFTCAVCFMHTFTFGRLYARLVYKCMTRDSIYLQGFIKNSHVQRAHVTHIRDLVTTPMLLEQCFEYCQNTDTTRTAERMVKFYRAIMEWKYGTKGERTIDKFVGLVGVYVKSDGFMFISLPSHLISNLTAIQSKPESLDPNVFQSCEEWILERMQTSWGVKFFDRLAESAKTPEELALEKATYEAQTMSMFLRAQNDALEAQSKSLGRQRSSETQDDHISIDLEDMSEETLQRKQKQGTTKEKTIQQQYHFYAPSNDFTHL